MLCSGTDKRPFNRGSPLRIERIGSHGKNPYRGSAKGSICGMARSCSFPVQDAIAPLWNALTTSSRSASKSSEQLGGELRAKLEACEQEVEALCRIANVGVRNRCAADASQRRTAHHPLRPIPAGYRMDRSQPLRTFAAGAAAVDVPPPPFRVIARQSPSYPKPSTFPRA